MLEAVRVGHPPRRKLIEDRPEPQSKLHRPREESVQWFLWIGEALEMCEIAACLDGEGEAVRHHLPPLRKLLRLRQAVETVVQFHGVELTGIRWQPFARRQIRRIQAPPPVAVMPSRTT